MSFSVDDLVASLSSNHIGQEARDLAALQSQLQTLFYPTMPATPTPHNRRGTHSNTPICRTPTSASFCWDRPELDRRRSNSVASSMAFARKEGEESGEHVELMDEDERMVEDMLFPAPPAAPHATPSQAQYACAPPASPTAQYTMRSRQPSVSTAYAPASAYDLSPSTASLFATTDPFYLAQLQAAQAPSFFSQYGMPAQQSPFIKGHFQGHALAQPLAGTPC